MCGFFLWKLNFMNSCHSQKKKTIELNSGWKSSLTSKNAFSSISLSFCCLAFYINPLENIFFIGGKCIPCWFAQWKIHKENWKQIFQEENAKGERLKTLWYASSEKKCTLHLQSWLMNNFKKFENYLCFFENAFYRHFNKVTFQVW